MDRQQKKALYEARASISAHLGSLEVRGGDGAELFVDGRPAGKLPHEGALRLEVGTHRLEARRDGTYPFVREITVPAGSITRETVSLYPLQAPPPAPPRFESAMSSPAQPAASARSSLVPMLGWSLIGGGVVAGAVATGALLHGNDRARDYNSDAACTGHADAPPSCEAAASASGDWKSVAGASFVGAGVLVTAGIVLLLWKSTAGASTRVQLATSPVAVRFHLSHSF